MKKIFFVSGISILLLLVAVYFVSRNSSDQLIYEGSGDVRIMTTLFPLYDFARSIGGDKAQVIFLLPPGAEPHGFEPTPSDIRSIHKADIFFYTSDMMEPWARRLLGGVDDENVSIRAVGEGLSIEHDEMLSELEHDHEEEDVYQHDEEYSEKLDHVHTGGDPHIWLDFTMAQQMVGVITEEIKEKDPENAHYYEENAQQLILQLAQLDEKYQNSLELCSSRKVLHAGHFAFGHMAQRYALDYEALQGYAPNAEVSPHSVRDMMKQIRDTGAKAIFAEDIINTEFADIFAEELSIESYMLSSAGNISRADFEAGVAFVDIMERNLTNLVTGLGCKKK